MIALVRWPDGRSAWRRFLGRGSRTDAVAWSAEQILDARRSNRPEPAVELLTEREAARRRKGEDGRPLFPRESKKRGPLDLSAVEDAAGELETAAASGDSDRLAEAVEDAAILLRAVARGDVQPPLVSMFEGRALLERLAELEKAVRDFGKARGRP